MPRPRKSDVRREIQALRRFYSDTELASLIGIQRFALDFQKQPAPVCVSVWLIHAGWFGPKIVTGFDVFTLGRYLRTPQQVVSCGVKKKDPLNITDVTGHNLSVKS